MRIGRTARGPASEKQKKPLKGRKIDVPKGITKGQASHLIAMLGRGEVKGSRSTG